MLYVFAGIALGLCIAALVGELRPGGNLFPGFDGYYDEREPVDYSGLFEFFEDDVPEESEWTVDEVVQTYAEIQAL